MTPEAIKSCCKALAFVFLTAGGLGSIACLPYAASPYLNVLGVVGIYFCAGAIMMTGGLFTYVYLETHK